MYFAGDADRVYRTKMTEYIRPREAGASGKFFSR